MEDGFIAQWLERHYAIDCMVPDSPEVRQELQRIVLKELAMGIMKPETKRYVLEQIEHLRSLGAQGIVLGCTEFPLIVKSGDVPFPVFDTTYLHSCLAVDFILGRHHWCPVKYFADSSKSMAGKRIVGVHPKNDLN